MTPIDFFLALVLIALTVSMLTVKDIFVVYFQVQLAEEVNDRTVKQFLAADEDFDEALKTVPGLGPDSKVWY